MATSARRIFVSEFMLWVVLAGLGVYFLLPLRQSIRLGMDLAGGTYLTLQVQTDKAVEAELAEKGDDEGFEVSEDETQGQHGIPPVGLSVITREG